MAKNEVYLKFQSLFRSVLCNSALETKHFCSPLPSYTHHRPTNNYHPAITTPVKNALCFWGKATKKKTEKQKTNVTKLLDGRFLLSAIQSLENLEDWEARVFGHQNKKTTGMMRKSEFICQLQLLVFDSKSSP